MSLVSRVDYMTTTAGLIALHWSYANTGFGVVREGNAAFPLPKPKKKMNILAGRGGQESCADRGTVARSLVRGDDWTMSIRGSDEDSFALFL